MTYCLCRCKECGATWRDWINMKLDSFAYALCPCERCRMVVNALCIPLEMNYVW